MLAVEQPGIHVSLDELRNVGQLAGGVNKAPHGEEFIANHGKHDENRLHKKVKSSVETLGLFDDVNHVPETFTSVLRLLATLCISTGLHHDGEHGSEDNVEVVVGKVVDVRVKSREQIHGSRRALAVLSEVVEASLAERAIAEDSVQ